jgi:hypothetical protein
LVTLEAVDSSAAVSAFATQAARQVREMSARIPEFYVGEFFNFFKDAIVAYGKSVVADCQRRLAEAQVEVQIGTVELQARLDAARAVGDRDAEHAIWQEREIRQAAAQAKVDDASRRAAVLSLHVDVCSDLASALGISFS